MLSAKLWQLARVFSSSIGQESVANTGICTLAMTLCGHCIEKQTMQSAEPHLSNEIKPLIVVQAI